MQVLVFWVFFLYSSYQKVNKLLSNFFNRCEENLTNTHGSRKHMLVILLKSNFWITLRINLCNKTFYSKVQFLIFCIFTLKILNSLNVNQDILIITYCSKKKESAKFNLNIFRRQNALNRQQNFSKYYGILKILNMSELWMNIFFLVGDSEYPQLLSSD